MIYHEEVALKVAEFLLQIKAVVLRPNEPFTWASGIKSPIYCDNRKTLSYPNVRNYIRQQICTVAEDKLEKCDFVAGVATGGIPHGALVAQELGLPFVYVRSAPKGHGLENLVEGEVIPGKKVLVIEDLVSTGKSSLQAVKALRESGLTVNSMISIFDYGFDNTQKVFEEAKCQLISLSNYDAIIKKAQEINYIKENQIETLKEWRKAPEKWGL
jgi:orotate phosphoribosyltransferase